MYIRYIFFLLLNNYLIVIYSSHSQFGSFRNIATGSGALLYSYWQYLLYNLQKNNYELMKDYNKIIENQSMKNDYNLDKTIKNNEDNINKQIINQNKISVITFSVPFLLIIFKYIFYNIFLNKINKNKTK